MWKISAVEAEGFRGINQRATLVCDPALTIVLGTNGSGKTSWAEAIEFVLTGSTQKLRQGLATSRKTEFEGTLRNLHAGTRLTDARVVLSDGTNELTVSRTLDTVEVVPESATVLVPSLPWHGAPVVLQHGLRSFIDAAPNERWDRVAMMLGLGDLESFAEFTKRTWTRFRSRHKAEREMPKQLEQQAMVRGFKTLGAAIRRQDLPSVRVAVGAIVTELTGKAGEPTQWSSNLDDYRRALSAKSFPVLFDSALVPLHQPTTADEWQSVEAALDRAAETAIRIAAQRIDPRMAERIVFLKQGLALVPVGATICPFCDEDTITPEKREAIQRVVDEHADQAAVTSARDDPATILRTIAAKMAQLKIPDLPEDERERLQADLGDACLEPLTAAQAEVRRAIGAVSAGDFPGKPSEQAAYEPNGVDAIVAMRSRASKLRAAETQVGSALAGYAAAVQALRTSAERIAATPAQALAIENAVWAVSAPDLLRRAVLTLELEKQLETAKTAAERTLLTVTDGRLAERRASILAWYALINPDEPVRLHDVKVAGTSARRSVDLIARTFDQEAHAAGILSESHLNAVGLSVYLSEVTGPANALRTVVFDDPAQSMDEIHTSRLADKVVRKLLEDGWQVIVLTHLEQVANELASIFRHLAPRYVRVTSSSPDGAVIAPIRPLLDLVDAVQRHAMTPDEGSRLASATNLRAFLDRFCEDLYTKHTGEPRMRIAGTGWVHTQQRVELLLRSVAVDVTDGSWLRHVIGVADPATHLLTDKEPPTPAQLKTFADKSRQLVAKYLTEPMPKRRPTA